MVRLRAPPNGTHGNATFHAFHTNVEGVTAGVCEERPFAPTARTLVNGSWPGESFVRPCTPDESDTFCGGAACSTSLRSPKPPSS